MESSGINIAPIYFNSNIDNFTSLLLTVGQTLPIQGTKSIDFDNNLIYDFATSSTWVDISQYSGTRTTIFGPDIDDLVSDVRSFGFNFILKGTTYTQFKISTNGCLFFGTNGTASLNSPSPSTIGVYPCLMFINSDMFTKINGIRSVLTADFLLIQNELYRRYKYGLLLQRF